MLASAQPSQQVSDGPLISPPLPPVPGYGGVGPLLLGAGIIGLMLSYAWRQGLVSLESTFAELSFGWLAVAVGLLLWGALQLRHSLRRRSLAGRHPLEPWRWDYSWRREVVDPGLTLPPLLAGLAGTLLAMGVAVFMLVLMGLMVLRVPELAGKLFLGAMTLIFGTVFALGCRAALSSTLRRWRTRWRFGAVHLRLPGIPLALGTHPQVELVLPRELPELSRVETVLRRVRVRYERSGSGKNRRTVTIRDVEFEKRSQQKLPKARGPGRNAVLTLKLPPPEPTASTWMGSKSQVIWELALIARLPDVTLEATFRLPVYLLPGTSTDVA